jgi:hypothetical protein
VQRWQVRLEALYHWLFQGLYLTRDIPALLRQGGFRVQQMEAGYLAEFPKSSSYAWWGVTFPQVRQDASTRPSQPPGTSEWSCREQRLS